MAFENYDDVRANDVSEIVEREEVERTFAWALEHGVNIAFGTDLLLDPSKSGRQSEMLTRLASLCGSSLAGLRGATSVNAELFRLSGNRHPYQSPNLTESDGAARPPHHYRLGVLAEGAWADMLLVDGDPTRDLGLLGDRLFPDAGRRRASGLGTPREGNFHPHGRDASGGKDRDRNKHDRGKPGDPRPAARLALGLRLFPASSANFAIRYS